MAKPREGLRAGQSGEGRLAQFQNPYLLNPAEWPILHLGLRESRDTHPFLVALPFQ
jgi:hypothetical protein